jgi:hypothetical protein
MVMVCFWLVLAIYCKFMAALGTHHFDALAALGAVLGNVKMATIPEVGVVQQVDILFAIRALAVQLYCPCGCDWCGHVFLVSLFTAHATGQTSNGLNINSTGRRAQV